MSDLITVQGVVLSAAPLGEYDKRLVLLTKERGKISAFAKGAKRPNSPFLAAANPFVFGSFTLYEGRSSYTLNQVNVSHHFVELAGEQPGVYYGFYFLELADYFGREGNDETELMNLLYVTLKALLNPKIDDEVVKAVYEFRLMVIQGEYPQLFSCGQCGEEEKSRLLYFSQSLPGAVCVQCAKTLRDARPISPSCLYALQFAAAVPLGRLYTFTLQPQVQKEMARLVDTYLERNTDKRFKSLEILKMMR